MAIGITYHGFWDMNPRILKIHSESYKIKRKMQDEQAWQEGMYTQDAVSVAFSNCLSGLFGKKPKARYLEKPMMYESEIETSLTQEEIDEKELRKMLLNEDMWIRQSKRKGLPETVII